MGHTRCSRPRRVDLPFHRGAIVQAHHFGNIYFLPPAAPRIKGCDVGGCVHVLLESGALSFRVVGMDRRVCRPRIRSNGRLRWWVCPDSNVGSRTIGLRLVVDLISIRFVVLLHDQHDQVGVVSCRLVRVQQVRRIQDRPGFACASLGAE